MKKKYYAIKIHNEIFVMNNTDELGELIDKDIPHTLIGQVCTEECSTMCLLYRKGMCPCETMKDVNGDFIHVFVNSNQ